MATYITKTIRITSAGQVANTLTSLGSPVVGGNKKAWWILDLDDTIVEVVVQSS